MKVCIGLKVCRVVKVCMVRSLKGKNVIRTKDDLWAS
jgi:hypothetical protein